MDIYLVGGAVRDQLLGYPVYDRDWVVVGATPDAMRQAGFTPVGSDFPVFLHPQTHEEYALARTERKSGRGYTGFQYFTSPDVTLEQDLSRRDLTINAMAQASDGTLIDPYGGQADLQQRCLRHVSPAFEEDPLRVLRVARFAARYAHLGFKVATETLNLMTKIAHAGELNDLTTERVWQETERALGERSVLTYFQVLAQSEALCKLFPELAALATLDASPFQDPAQDSEQRQSRFAALLYICFQDQPSQALSAFCQRIKAPNQFRDRALHLHVSFKTIEHWHTCDAQARFDVLQSLDLMRRPQRLDALTAAIAITCEWLKQPACSTTELQQLLEKMAAIKPADLMAEGFKGPALGAEIKRRQLALCQGGER